MTCPACDALRQEVARLQAELQQALNHRSSSIVRDAFGLGVRGADLLLALYQANGDVLPREHLKAIARDHGAGDNLLRVYIGRLRDVLGPGALLNARGAGYRLSPAGLELVGVALRGEALADPVREQAA